MSKGYEKGVLTHSKGRLLFHLVWFGKIKCDPSVSKELTERLGYKSAGHWHKDVSDLINDGYITLDKKRGCYIPTEKAKDVFEPVVSLRTLVKLNTVAAIVILLVGFANLLSNQLIWYIFLFLVATYICVINIYIVSPVHLIFKKKSTAKS